MSTRSSNHAAYLVGVGKPLEVREGPTGKPGSGQLRIRNGAVAINPVDWKMQDSGAFVQSWPTVLGCDLAGEVVEVGEGVGDFKPGQRVLAHPVGLATGEVVEDAFQNYTIVRAVVTAPIPDDMSFEQACVLPLSLSTAADGLFGKSHLGFPYPSNNPKKSGKTLLVWGGSSSVGSSVIQLAVAAGFDVVTTASKRNFEYCKKLGAKAVFDHSSPSIVGDLVAELQKGEIAGAYDAIGTRESSMNAGQVLAQLGGGYLASALTPPDDLPATVNSGRVFAPKIALQTPEVAKAVYGDFLPEALKTGQLKAMPEPIVVGTGLDHLQDAMTKLKAGVSASKIVVKL